MGFVAGRYAFPSWSLGTRGRGDEGWGKLELPGKRVPKPELGNEGKMRELGNEGKMRELGNEVKKKRKGRFLYPCSENIPIIKGLDKIKDRQHGNPIETVRPCAAVDTEHGIYGHLAALGKRPHRLLPGPIPFL